MKQTIDEIALESDEQPTSSKTFQLFPLDV